MASILVCLACIVSSFCVKVSYQTGPNNLKGLDSIKSKLSSNDTENVVYPTSLFVPELKTDTDPTHLSETPRKTNTSQHPTGKSKSRRIKICKKSISAKYCLSPNLEDIVHEMFVMQNLCERTKGEQQHENLFEVEPRTEVDLAHAFASNRTWEVRQFRTSRSYSIKTNANTKKLRPADTCQALRLEDIVQEIVMIRRAFKEKKFNQHKRHLPHQQQLIISKLKFMLFHGARLLSLSTFLQDGCRMHWYFQTKDHLGFMDMLWGNVYIRETLFVLINLIVQFGGCMMILCKIKVAMACALLCCVILFQILAFENLWDIRSHMKNLTMIGILVLLMIEDTNRKSFPLLLGRVSLSFMVISMLRMKVSLMHVIKNVVVSTLAIFLTIGLQTKPCALLLATWLNIMNFYLNAWWERPSYKRMRDFRKHEFFRILSVTGALLHIVAWGPGGFSIDEPQ